MSRNHRWLAALAGACVALVLGLGACSVTTAEPGRSGASQVRDAGGKTQAEVAQLSLEQEFELFGERYEHANAYLEEGQRLLSDGEWEWIDSGMAPKGHDGPGLAGATGDTSYTVTPRRVVQLGSTYPDAAVTRRLEQYFAKRGWRVGHDRVASDINLAAFTGDGYTIEYVFRKDGRTSLRVKSPPYWTNDSLELGKAVISRLEVATWKHSKPGKFIAFPRWEDPVVQSFP